MPRSATHSAPRRAALDLVAVLALAWCMVGCGDDGRGTTEPHMPAPNDPAFGTVGNILVSDRLSSEDSSVDAMWIGFNRTGEWADLMALGTRHAGGAIFIGGHVLRDTAQPLGFRLDPDTTSAGEVVAEGIATTLDRIKADPDGFAAQQPFGRWAFRISIERVAPSGAN